MIEKNNIETLFESRYIKVYDLKYAKDQHYFNASRRSKEDLPFSKSDEAFKKMIPDAVSCVVVLEMDGQDYLLLTYEYRYPAGQFLLSVPAGIIDSEDKQDNQPIIKTAIREIEEETGIKVKETDSVSVLNPALFSTPGMCDETNAIALAHIHLDNLECLSQAGAVGSELFNGFEILDKTHAKKILLDGVDKNGIFYSVYTWIALSTFVSELYK